MQNLLNNSGHGAGNSNPLRAPSHLQMANNLAAEFGQSGEFPENTNIGMMKASNWRTLRDHLSVINEIPQCVCFNCGQLMYRAYTKTICAKNIQVPSDTRGYRVFEHYITLLAKKFTPPGHALNLSSVFLCEPQANGQAKVFSCYTCSHDGTDSTGIDAQDPAQYDLFDGVDEANHFTTIGIGDKQPDAIAKLNQDERLSLSVLKLVDATFKAYSGHAGYTHMSGGALLTPQDFSGLACLLTGDKTHVTRDEQKMLDAINVLRQTNPLIKSTMSCFETQPISHDKLDRRRGGARAAANRAKM
jgi:hypothetical protein